MYVYEPHGTRLIGFLFELFLFLGINDKFVFSLQFFLWQAGFYFCAFSDSVNHLINSYLFIHLTELRDFLFIRSFVDYFIHLLSNYKI